MHDVGEEQQGIVFLCHTIDFAPDHGHPFVEHLLQIVRRDLRADDVTGLNGDFDGTDEFVFVRRNFERHKVRADVSRDFVQGLWCVLAGGLAPLDGLLGEERQHISAFHERGFFGVDHGQKRRHGFALVQRHLHVVQQLREHGVGGRATRVFGFKPDFIGLNVDQPLGEALESKGFDVSVFNVFFALGGLQLGIQAHDWIAWLD